MLSRGAALPAVVLNGLSLVLAGSAAIAAFLGRLSSVLARRPAFAALFSRLPLMLAGRAALAMLRLGAPGSAHRMLRTRRSASALPLAGLRLCE